MTEVVIGSVTYELRADFEALMRLETYFGKEWKWFRETPRIFAEGPTIAEAINFFRALLVVPAGGNRLTPADVAVLFATKLNVYTKCFAACKDALAAALADLSSEPTEGQAADPQ